MVVSKKMCAMKITKYFSTDLRNFFKTFHLVEAKSWTKEYQKHQTYTRLFITNITNISPS